MHSDAASAGRRAVGRAVARLTDLPERDGARAVAVRLHDAAQFAGGLGRELLARRLAAGGLARGLLRASHVRAVGGGGAVARVVQRQSSSQIGHGLNFGELITAVQLQL